MSPWLSTPSFSQFLFFAFFLSPMLCDSLSVVLPLSTILTAWHNKPVNIFLDGCVTQHRLYERSLFGTANVYNRLHQCLIDISSVKGFQSVLTDVAKQRCNAGDIHWKESFHSDSEVWRTRRFMDWGYLTYMVFLNCVFCNEISGVG